MVSEKVDELFMVYQQACFRMAEMCNPRIAHPPVAIPSGHPYGPFHPAISSTQNGEHNAACGDLEGICTDFQDFVVLPSCSKTLLSPLASCQRDSAAKNHLKKDLQNSNIATFNMFVHWMSSITLLTSPPSPA